MHAWSSLDPRAVGAEQTKEAVIGGIATAAIAAIGALVPAGAVAWLLWSLAALILLWTIVTIVVLHPKAVRAFAYRCTDRAIEIDSGVLIRSHRFVPMRQILVVERRVGPFLRSRGIVAARLHLADGSVDVHGIDDAAFDRIRTAIAEGSRAG